MKSWLNAKLPPAGYDRLINAAGCAQEFARPMAVGWYSVPDLVKVLTLAGAELKMTVEQIAQDIARQNAEHDLKTLYRVFMSVLGPVNVMRRSEQMYRTYTAFGEAKTTRNEHGLYECEVRDVPAELAAWIRGVSLGFLCTAITAAGGKQPVGEHRTTVSQPNGKLTLPFTIRYR